jgi:uncharacterized protein YacL (UPF0231 family)
MHTRIVHTNMEHIRVARWYIFEPKKNLGKFWRALEWKRLAYSTYGHLECAFYGHLIHTFYGHWVI